MGRWTITTFFAELADSGDLALPPKWRKTLEAQGEALRAMAVVERTAKRLSLVSTLRPRGRPRKADK